MYKLLLSWRYLRTRFIALASIVSVTLGVATLIVVNSVMSGFITEMNDRLHGILSDVQVVAPGLSSIHDPKWHREQIEKAIGDEIAAITEVVQVPALMHYNVNGFPMTQQVVLVGIDDETFGQVTDFHPYLMNAQHRLGIDFKLQDEGYDPALGECGWPHRKKVAALNEQYRRHYEELQRQNGELSPTQVEFSGPDVNLPAVPQAPPDLDNFSGHSSASLTGPPQARDSFDRYIPGPATEDIFNPMSNQHTGIVLGLALSSRQFTHPETGDEQKTYLMKPGDDIYLTLPTAGANPTAIRENFTIVDFYNSNMHEYDSSFAFMSLSRLQKIRGMVHPYTGSKSVSAFQIKLKPGADLNAARNKLQATFPVFEFGYIVQTWEDQQRPLLNAVNMELVILNILLFLIIAVAGFGILATFFMIVVEKTKDIGILKSLGASSRGVMAIFLGYGLSLGTVGTGVGILAGLLFVHYINPIAKLIGRLAGRDIFDPTMYYFDSIPTIVSTWMVAGVAVGAILIAVLAAVLPALRAARMHPVHALRYE